MEAKIVKLGSVYFDDKPVEVGATYKNGELSLGDTTPGQELQWVDDGGYLITDRCVCVNISQNQVLQQGFLFGSPVRIDGRSYLCRCLKVGNKIRRPNEWDDLLLKYGTENSLWHWKDQYFLGQEIPESQSLYCVVRGGTLANNWDMFGTGLRASALGFRPLLQPLAPSAALNKSLIGVRVSIYGPQHISFGGELVSFDNYDLVLRGCTPIPAGCRWTYKEKDIAIVQRSAVIWMREEDNGS